MRRLIATLVATVSLVLVPAPASQAAPLRSGTIVGGYYPFAPGLSPGPGPDCTWNVDCLPWLVAGCPAELTGIDPALHSSIVDVSALAGSKKRRTFTIHPTARLLFQGVSVQLWSRSCREVFQVWQYGDTAIWHSARFRIPKGTKWMTVASVDTPPLTWTLR